MGKSPTSDRKSDGYDVDARVRQVLELHAKGELTAERRKSFAEEWGCGHSQVGAAIATAMRIIRLYRPDFEDDLNMRLAAIEDDRRTAKARVKYFTYRGKVVDQRPDPDARTMLACDEAYLAAIGALVRTRQTASTGEEAGDVSALLQIEIKNNPQLMRTVLDQLGKDELTRLLGSPQASVPETDALAQNSAENEQSPEPICTDETARAENTGKK